MVVAIPKAFSHAVPSLFALLPASPIKAFDRWPLPRRLRREAEGGGMSTRSGVTPLPPRFLFPPVFPSIGSRRTIHLPLYIRVYSPPSFYCGVLPLRRPLCFCFRSPPWFPPFCRCFFLPLAFAFFLIFFRPPARWLCWSGVCLFV